MNITELCVNCKQNNSCTMCWKTSNKKCPHFIQKTNADRILAMSDEELAKWLLDVMSHKVACFGEGAFPYAPCRNTEHNCVKCGLVWLQQPAE